LLRSLLKKITVFNEESVTDESRQRAFELCSDVDEKDIPFVAITMELDGLLWTKDRALMAGLKTKGFNSFFEVECL